MWKTNAQKLGLRCPHPVLLQSVNRLIFNTLLIEYCSAKFAPIPTAAHVPSDRMGSEEENALRYACGYTPFKLMKKFEKQGTQKAAQFVECLSNMAVGVENEESSFYNYTCEWVKAVDRGGLFHVSDYGFMLFKAIEIKTKEFLPQHLKSSLPTSKEVLITTIMEDHDVQFHLSMLTVDIDSDDNATELLQVIVEKWVTIRGFSVTSSWTEQYKQAVQQTTKRSKGLQKRLQTEGTHNKFIARSCVHVLQCHKLLTLNRVYT